MPSRRPSAWPRTPSRRGLWLSLAAGAISPAGLAISDPALAAALIGIEALAATLGTMLILITLTLAALRGSATTSERAFRLLRLLGDHPEQRPARVPRRHRRRTATRAPIGPGSADAIAAASTDGRQAW